MGRAPTAAIANSASTTRPRLLHHPHHRRRLPFRRRPPHRRHPAHRPPCRLHHHARSHLRTRRHPRHHTFARIRADSLRTPSATTVATARSIRSATLAPTALTAACATLSRHRRRARRRPTHPIRQPHLRTRVHRSCGALMGSRASKLLACLAACHSLSAALPLMSRRAVHRFRAATRLSKWHKRARRRHPMAGAAPRPMRPAHATHLRMRPGSVVTAYSGPDALRALHHPCRR